MAKSGAPVEAKRSLSHFTVIWRVLGASWAIFGVPWAIFGDLGAMVEVTWGQLVSISGFCEGGLGAKSGAPAGAKRSLS